MLLEPKTKVLTEEEFKKEYNRIKGYSDIAIKTTKVITIASLGMGLGELIKTYSPIVDTFVLETAPTTIITFLKKPFFYHSLMGFGIPNYVVVFLVASYGIIQLCNNRIEANKSKDRQNRKWNGSFCNDNWRITKSSIELSFTNRTKRRYWRKR